MWLFGAEHKSRRKNEAHSQGFKYCEPSCFRGHHTSAIFQHSLSLSGLNATGQIQNTNE